MDSGIYQLTFNTGDTYIGKSLHLQTRWKQHVDKLHKGTAAKNMMIAYAISGYVEPTATVLLKCHPDVLDAYENYFIRSICPNLNTQWPLAKTEGEYEALIRHMEEGNAEFSVPVIIMSLENMHGRLSLVEEEFQELSKSWEDRALRDSWENAEYRKVVEERDRLGEVIDIMNNANWWQRLWGTWHRK